MFEVTIGIDIGKEHFEAGSLVPEDKVPKKSLKWLKDQGILVKAERARNEKGHFVADDPTTQKNEAYEEEEWVNVDIQAIQVVVEEEDEEEQVEDNGI